MYSVHFVVWSILRHFKRCVLVFLHTCKMYLIMSPTLQSDPVYGYLMESCIRIDACVPISLWILKFYDILVLYNAIFMCRFYCFTTLWRYFFIMTPFFIHLFRTIKILVVERYLNQNISMAFEWGKKVSQCKYLLQNIWPYICSFCWWMVYEGTSWRSAHRINIDWTWLVVKDFKRVCYNYSLWYCHF